MFCHDEPKFMRTSFFFRVGRLLYLLRACVYVWLVFFVRQERIARPRAEEVEMEAFELAVDAQVWVRFYIMFLAVQHHP